MLYILLLGLMFINNSYAASSGSITIQGNVAASTNITVTPETGYNALDLHTSQVNKKIATVTEQNNTQNGYTVSISSANNGQLKNGSLGQVSYTAKYNGSSFTLSTTPVQVTNEGSQSSIVNMNKDITIDYTGVPASALMQGTYSDTLTITIQGN